MAANDPSFLARYDSIMAAFDAEMKDHNTWFASNYSNVLSGPVAYFSAEFALHNSLPIYAGGLGVLAGDLCKEASDLGLPMVAVGFMYPQGYFQQRISPEGWQEEIYKQIGFNEAPIDPCVWPEGCGPLVQVQLGNKTIHVGVWQVRLGRINLYLMDTNVEENAQQDRELSSRLYIADREQRIQQEIILGIGGVRVLRALGIEPSVWHANEGHTAFMTLERLREEVARGISFPEAVQRVQAATVFTTHTPIPAGHDVFDVSLVEKYFHNYWGLLGIDKQKFLELGQYSGSGSPEFNMTILALKMSGQRNAVSQLHGKVAQKMWSGLWPGVKEEEIPIIHVTNGVHVPTWIAPELFLLLEMYLGKDLLKRQDDAELWRRIMEIPDDEVGVMRQILRRKLVRFILDRAQKQWADGGVAAEQVIAAGALLDPDVLTIAFVRRFTEYKRPALIFRDVERLKRIVRDEWRPIQIIFAGKSHPADFASKYLMQQVYNLAKDRAFQGRICFVEDYDMHMARYLAQGVDVWLNTPRRLQEACGTSGMKASINGCLHFSVRDGWWHEGYNNANGWAIGEGPGTFAPADEDKADAESIYSLLEEKIVPLFYERDREGVPHGWVRLVKEAIASILPAFCARRMMKEYVQRMYLPIAQSVKK